MQAQSAKIEFTGRVFDEESKEPVVSAAIRFYTLPDSAFIGGGTTGLDGAFGLTIPVRKNSKLVVEVSFIGYKTVCRPVNPYTGRRMGDILISPEGFTLQETIITGKAPMAITENDTTVFNSTAFRTPEGSMLEELVKQLPGSEISADGKLLIHGKEVKKILVDGKEFFSDDPQVAIKNLPVEMIDKLRAYERKSDLARLTGIDDGEDEMILDLSVKEGMKKGWINNLMGGIGNKNHYELANTLNRFRENSQFTVIGNLNNTNNQGFAELQQESSTATGNKHSPAGLSTSRSVGANFSHDWAKVKLQANMQYAKTDRSENSSSITDNFLRAEESITKGSGENRMQNAGVIVNASLEWKIDTVTNLIFRPSYRFSGFDRDGRNYQKSWSDANEVNEKESSDKTESSQFNVAVMLQVSRKLNRRGRNIALKVDYGTNGSVSDRFNNSVTRYFKSNTEKSLNQNVYNDTQGDNYRAQLIYAEPLPWLHFLQLRYSYQYRVASSDRCAYNWDQKLLEFLEDPDTLSSNHFENQYSNHLISLSIRASRKKYNYNVGMELEPQKSVSDSYVSDVLQYSLPRKVLNFSPTVNYRYKFSKRTRLQLTYRGKGRQPSVRDLQPIADDTNPLNVRIGNPGLKPSYTSLLDFSFNSYHVKRQRNLIAQLTVQSTQNSVTNLVTYNSETGGRTTMPVNMNGNWEAEGAFSLSTPFKNAKWLFRTYSKLGFSNRNGYTTLDKEEPLKSSVRHLSVRERMDLTYRIRQIEVGVKASVLYNHSYNNVKSIRTETFDYQPGVDFQWYLPWGFEYFSDITYFLRTGYGGNFGERDNLIWNLQFTKSLFKNKPLLLRFKIYDLLKQENALTRTITATYIRDTESDVLGRYFMIHIIWRLNKLGRR